METNWLENEMQRIESMEARYRWAAELVKPGELEEDPARSVRSYLAALRGLERCMELRLKLVRTAGQLPEPEAGEPLATVDLSRLSIDALEEVEAALVPVSPAAPPNEDTDRERLCETKPRAAAEPSRKRTKTETTQAEKAAPDARTPPPSSG